ncbi:response regulator [Oscillatoria salina]|uniref:response regulator n=1 Tax=Oscillatoria salina TaxID=331517 RepID=UPI001CCDCCE5|nr:response regulator [Oscillatoria salina]MBZ8183243.1 response regulator [Oscillatoria salina IIICB1]
MRILIIDPDRAMTKALATALRGQNHVVDLAGDGQTGWELGQSYNYDLIILDVVLPKIDGITLCRKLRKHQITTPILLLTDRDDNIDRAHLLETGANDYITKPFDWSELLTRIRFWLHQRSSSQSGVLSWGKLSLNSATCQVTYAGKPVSLRPKEYSLLELFLRYSDRILNCELILKQLWAYNESPGEQAVRAHIKGLRQQLRKVDAGNIIETVYGLGYRLKPQDRLAISQSKINENNGSLPANLQQALAISWENLKQDTLAQVAILKQAARQLLDSGKIDPDLHSQAINEAHKLAGFVGTFGFTKASYLARQIEDLLEQSSYFNEQEAAFCQRWTENIEQELTFSQPSLPYFPEANSEEIVRKTNLEKIKVLVVDDDPQILRIIKKLLDSRGLETTTLENPCFFWEVLEKVAPDLVILDVKMPFFDGIELCKLIRKHSEWAKVPVLFLTAYNSTENLQKVFNVGADDFVSKPFIGTELVTRIIARIERNRFLRGVTPRNILKSLDTLKTQQQAI